MLYQHVRVSNTCSYSASRRYKPQSIVVVEEEESDSIKALAVASGHMHYQLKASCSVSTYLVVEVEEESDSMKALADWTAERRSESASSTMSGEIRNVPCTDALRPS